MATVIVIFILSHSALHKAFGSWLSVTRLNTGFQRNKKYNYSQRQASKALY